jgi:hypothetical protein
MKKTYLLAIGFAVLAALAFTSSSGAQTNSRFVRPVSNCARSGYEGDGAFMIENVCNINIVVFYTSRGDIWGGMPIGPGSHSRTAYNGQAVERVGGVSIYACPEDSTPVRPDGSEMGPHYTGREYTCGR